MVARRTIIKRIDKDLEDVIKEISKQNQINETMASRLIAKRIRSRRILDEIKF